MTTQADAPAPSVPQGKPRRILTPGRIIEILIVLIALGVALWALGVFKKNPKIAIITSGEGPYWDLVESGAKKAAEMYDAEVTVIRCKTDMDAQIEAIKDALTKDYDGIAVSPINPVGEAAVLSDVATRGTLVTLDSDSPVARRLCFVGTDNYEAGRMSAQLVRRAIPDGGEVIICIGNADKENTQHRRQGLIDDLLERTYEPDRNPDAIDAPLKGPKYSIVATLVDGGDPASAADLVIEAVKQHADAKCIVGLLSYSAPSIVSALDTAKKIGAVKVVGFDAAEGTLVGVENGDVFGTIVQDQFGCGYHTVRILAESARGDHSELPVFSKRTLPCEVVTKENVANVRRQLKGEPPVPATQPTTQQTAQASG
jgi:ribose transport system substrate-binding protein